MQAKVKSGFSRLQRKRPGLHHTSTNIEKGQDDAGFWQFAIRPITRNPKQVTALTQAGLDQYMKWRWTNDRGRGMAHSEVEPGEKGASDNRGQTRVPGARFCRRWRHGDGKASWASGSGRLVLKNPRLHAMSAEARAIERNPHRKAGARSIFVEIEFEVGRDALVQLWILAPVSILSGFGALAPSKNSLLPLCRLRSARGDRRRAMSPAERTRANATIVINGGAYGVPRPDRRTMPFFEMLSDPLSELRA
jgi:hypothetical protein